MAGEGQAHLVSLKVMRISRPSLATAWEPFYSNSPSFSAHSTASLMSLQTKEALPGFPKTLRDLTHATEVMMLPATFGAIQLGETFSSCIALNNDSSIFIIEGASLRVEVQSTSSKMLLAEIGGPTYRLAPGDTVEQVINYDIKELGQHVLACTVSYNLPESVRRDRLDAEMTQTFRKFYKFQVTNPLSVKTKVHVPRAPSALLSSWEREKVFLELHVQNLTQEPMWIQSIEFEPTDTWSCEDPNLDKNGETIFSGSMALMEPQDLRQYIYTLTPKILPKFHAPLTPGSSVPLGKMHLAWRTAFGEPGRLSTSLLHRKVPPAEALIPQPPISVTSPKSAVPPYLQRSNTIGGVPQRMQSPQQRPLSPPISAGGTPAPYRPGSPFRNRGSIGSPIPARIQSPAPVPLNPAVRRPGEDIDVDLTVNSIPRDSICLEKPFVVGFTVTVRVPIPPPPSGQRRKHRLLTLVVQHLEPSKPSAGSNNPPVQAATLPGTWTPQVPSSGLSTPSPYATPYRGDFSDSLAQRLLSATPRQNPEDGETGAADEDEDDGRETARETPAVRPKRPIIPSLPPPVATGPDEGDPKKAGVRFLGHSALVLPPLRLVASPDLDSPEDNGDDARGGHDRNSSTSTITTTTSEADSELEVLVGGGRAVQVIGSQNFELQYVPVKAGFVNVGGIRVLVIEDRLVEEGELGHHGRSESIGQSKVRTLRSWDVVAEVWVQPGIGDGSKEDDSTMSEIILAT